MTKLSWIDFNRDPVRSKLSWNDFYRDPVRSPVMKNNNNLLFGYLLSDFRERSIYLNASLSGGYHIKKICQAKKSSL